ncbi:MAG TPA: hypothetical protein VK171_01195 [Fimbriimonas sp.]|nr:hypothetical protein [Fimbriimonas sp.]
MTFDDVVAKGSSLPGVVEALAWGTPALKRGKRMMIRLSDDGQHLVARVPWEFREAALQNHAQHCFITPHYENYPAVLVRLDGLTHDLMSQVTEASYEFALVPDKKR